jgi:hypothetical protein
MTARTALERSTSLTSVATAVLLVTTASSGIFNSLVKLLNSWRTNSERSAAARVRETGRTSVEVNTHRQAYPDASERDVPEHVADKGCRNERRQRLERTSEARSASE